MRISRTTLLIWLIVAVLLLLVWLTASGRLGKSRHGYAATIPALAGTTAPGLEARLPV